MSVYFAIIENAYDRDLAQAMSGHMRVALNSGWDNEMSICARVCGLEVTQDLRELVAGIDGVVGSPEFQEIIGPAVAAGSNSTDSGEIAIPPTQFCVWRPNSPQCTDP